MLTTYKTAYDGWSIANLKGRHMLRNRGYQGYATECTDERPKGNNNIPKRLRWFSSIAHKMGHRP